jgi:tRNA-2-methylthio-N6-dimethylallyladenosine synthase
MISGFCSETKPEHVDTLSLMNEVKFDFSYMFIYSERPGTPAAKSLKDDVPEKEKKRRLEEIIQLQTAHSLEQNRRDVGKSFRVLVEGPSRRSEDYLQGRNSANKVVVFPKGGLAKGMYATIRVTDCTSATLLGEVA